MLHCPFFKITKKSLENDPSKGGMGSCRGSTVDGDVEVWEQFLPCSMKLDGIFLQLSKEVLGLVGLVVLISGFLSWKGVVEPVVAIIEVSVLCSIMGFGSFSSTSGGSMEEWVAQVGLSNIDSFAPIFYSKD